MIRTRLQGDAPFFPNMLNNGKVEVCLKEDVDKEIREKDAEIESLKAKLESVQASAYADSVDAGMRERRLRRALYKACANWAHYVKDVLFRDEHEAEKWGKMELKCLKKAEEYR